MQTLDSKGSFWAEPWYRFPIVWTIFCHLNDITWRNTCNNIKLAHHYLKPLVWSYEHNCDTLTYIDIQKDKKCNYFFIIIFSVYICWIMTNITQYYGKKYKHVTALDIYTTWKFLNNYSLPTIFHNTTNLFIYLQTIWIVWSLQSCVNSF